MVLMPSIAEDAVQRMPIKAIVNTLCGGPEVISSILVLTEDRNFGGIESNSRLIRLVPVSELPIIEAIETKKIKNGNNDKINKNARYPACSTPSWRIVSLTEYFSD
jgi:hypothetical protein|tara:strand:+ start:1572 stop:1889 length:318 start_codon:yes stop_codon:yes gene_type:complete